LEFLAAIVTADPVKMRGLSRAACHNCRGRPFETRNEGSAIAELKRPATNMEFGTLFVSIYNYGYFHEYRLRENWRPGPTGEWMVRASFHREK
jgi:hypothetical protein